eukprot:snap_masked-scaffold_14-processed-gene-10.45-mRNA-1 protein AED:0.11 eAED:0.11 QI:0/-1/0/1/-1/1/1/0/146
MKKGAWSKEEDKILLEAVFSYLGEKSKLRPVPRVPSWTFIRKDMPHRTIKQCRDRWVTAVCPDINKEEWSTYEDMKILELRALLGNKWALIGYLLNTSRSHSLVKNRFKYLLRNSAYTPERRDILNGQGVVLSLDDLHELTTLLSE